MFSRSKMVARHKSLVFFRVTFAHSCRQSHVLCVLVCIFCTHLCDSVLMRCSLWQAVPESSWSFNAILRCFLRAVYGNVVFLRYLLTSVSCFDVFFQALLKPFMGMSYFLVQKCTHVTKVSCFSVHLPFVLAP